MIILSSLIILLLVVIIIFSFSVKTVKHDEVMIIERLGKFHKVLNEGLHIILPFFDAAVKTNITEENGKFKISETVSLKENILEYKKEQLITKDNHLINAHIIVRFKIDDPVKSVYNIAYVSLALDKLIKTIARNLIGEINLKDVALQRSYISTDLEKTLSDAAEKWGIKIIRTDFIDYTTDD